MSSDAYLRPPEDIDMAAEERAIRRAGWVALPIVAATSLAGHALLPMMFAFPVDLADRLAFGLRALLFVWLWVLVGVLMVSTGRRHSAEDIGGSAAGPPSARLRIRCAFLQNTLEQAVLAAGAHLALVTLVAGDALALVVVAVVLFALGRISFLRGYARGAGGRALGMMLTMLPTMLVYVLALGLVLARMW